MAPTHNYTEYLVERQPEISGIGNEPSTVGGLWLALYQAFHGVAAMETAAQWMRARTAKAVGLGYLRSPDASDISTDAVTWDDQID